MTSFGVNIPWVTDAPRSDLYALYDTAFARARDVGFNTFRVWAAPWEIPYGSNADEYIERRAAHFGQLSALAAKHQATVVVCLFLHVEFLARNAGREVEDRRHAWFGHCLNAANGGPLRAPADIFGDSGIRHCSRYVEAVVDAVPSEARVDIELMNEIDRVTGYRRAAAAAWTVRCRREVARRMPSSTVMASCADPFEMLSLARRAPLDCASVHIHGWPDSDLCRSLAVVDSAFREAGQPFQVTEISPDATAAPSDSQLTNWAAGIVLPALITGASGYPWWWETLDGDERLREVLRAGFEAASGRRGSVEIHVPDLTREPTRHLERLARRWRLAGRPAMWKRLARQTWRSRRHRQARADGPWSVELEQGTVCFSQGRRERPTWPCVNLEVGR